MKKIVDYEVLIASRPRNLINEVTEAIDKGWQPLGGCKCTAN